MKVGGRDFNLTKKEVETRMKDQVPELVQKHVVQVNGQMFPPKQVLGHVTGWARTSFTTMEAQRVLTRIGFICSEARGGRLRQVGDLVLDAVRDSAHHTLTDHGDAHHAIGFSRASGIALRRIDAKLDSFREQMKASGLSHAEQAVYAHLDELRLEIEADCDVYWRETGVEWRPPKPVANGVIRRAVERDR